MVNDGPTLSDSPRIVSIALVVDVTLLVREDQS